MLNSRQLLQNKNILLLIYCRKEKGKYFSTEEKEENYRDRERGGGKRERGERESLRDSE